MQKVIMQVLGAINGGWWYMYDISVTINGIDQTRVCAKGKFNRESKGFSEFLRGDRARVKH